MKTSLKTVGVIQRDYRDRGLVVVGVAAAETGGPKPVHSYLDALGPVVNYSIAYVEDGGETYSRWVRAGRGSGLPWVFLVDRDGTIAWWGQPFYSEFTEKLNALLTDRQVGPARVAKMDGTAEAEEGWILQRTASRAIDEKNWTDALETIDRLIELDSERYWFETATKFRILLLELQRRSEAYAFGNRLIHDVARTNASSLDLIARWILAQEADQQGLALAEDAAERAVQLTSRKNAEVLATLANVQERSGQADLAEKTREEALAVADTVARKQIEDDSRRQNRKAERRNNEQTHRGQDDGLQGYHCCLQRIPQAGGPGPPYPDDGTGDAGRGVAQRGTAQK